MVGKSQCSTSNQQAEFFATITPQGVRENFTGGDDNSEEAQELRAAGVLLADIECALEESRAWVTSTLEEMEWHREDDRWAEFDFSCRVICRQAIESTQARRSETGEAS